MLAAGRPYDAFFRQSGQAMGLLPHEQLLSDGYDNPPYTNKRDSPELEQKTAVTHRKRVPVACERCRKRKIKCSGDQGDGSGCDNCKSAGWDGCQFLRVRSSILDCHPAISSNRTWQHQHHYHPYSRGRNVQHVQQTYPYVQQNIVPFSAWQSGPEYTGLSAASATVPWSQNTYTTTYPMYGSEATSPYDTRPPSYMQPDPGYEARSSMNYVSSMPRPPQNLLWLDQTNSASIPQHNTQISPVYPLTPIESSKSYPIFGGQPRQHPLSNERILPVLSVSEVPPAVTSYGQDTPPLSAVSHRSSYTWNTDTASHVSQASSRTSCGGSQDLSATRDLHTCDESGVYQFPIDSSTTHVNIPASALPIATDTNEQQQMPQAISTISTDHSVMNLHNRASRENVRATSTTDALYSYTNGRSMTRRDYAKACRLLTNGFRPTWNTSPTACQNDTLPSQQPGDTEQYVEHQTTAT